MTFRGTYAWPDGGFNVILHPKALDPTFYNTGYINSPHPELGAGPFRLASFDRTAGTVTLERNPKWWGDTAKLDKRVFLQMDSQASINAFKNNQIDATSVATKDRLAQVQGMGGISIRKSAQPSQDLVTLNSKSPARGDSAVRGAILKAIDRKVVADVLFQGLGYSEQAPGSFLLYPFQKGYEDNLKGVIDFDANSAESALQAAGWVPGGDGIRTKGRQRLSLTFPVTGDDPTVLNLARALQAMEKSVGRRSADRAEVVQRLLRHHHQQEVRLLRVGVQFERSLRVGLLLPGLLLAFTAEPARHRHTRFRRTDQGGGPDRRPGGADRRGQQAGARPARPERDSPPPTTGRSSSP